MQQVTESSALSSGECVREIGLRLMHMSEGIHNGLRRLTSAPISDSQTTSPYALLTEEYALRARVSILLIEADRLARPGFPASQKTVLEALDQVEAALSHSSTSDEINELIASLLLFTSSIISRRNQIIMVLLDNLKQTAAEMPATK